MDKKKIIDLTTWSVEEVYDRYPRCILLSYYTVGMSRVPLHVERELFEMLRRVNWLRLKPEEALNREIDIVIGVLLRWYRDLKVVKLDGEFNDSIYDDFVDAPVIAVFF